MHNHVVKSSAKSSASTPVLTGPLPTVSIVGARGYTGLELARLLLQHPAVYLTHAFATKAFQLTDDLLAEGAESIKCLPESELFQNLTDIVFLATPSEVSMELAPKILQAGKKVIDLSGAFRLKKNEYQKWYGFSHTSLETLGQTHYGLVPLSGPLPSDVKMIANPGCYATAISMALAPLIKKGLIKTDTLVIDAKSGTTGAGRKASESILFSEVDGECLPYKVGRHQHTPEIQECIENLTSVNLDLQFTTHLLPVKRGIIASLYAKTLAKSVDEITQAYEETFADYPFVRFGPQISKLASLNKVVGTPYTHISYEVVGDKLYLFSCIDNLLKGAASQAIENLNCMMDWTVTLGLQNPKEKK